MAGTTGTLSGDEKLAQLSSGDVISGSMSFRPAFGFASDFSASLKYLKSVTKGEPDPIQGMRTSFLASLRGVSTDSAALVAGLAIGDDSQLSAQTKEDFRKVSLTHLSAVSGANCAIVLAGVAFLLNLLPIARPFRIFVSFAAIGFYLALVGQEPSVLRASAMVGVVLLGFLIGRRVSPLDAIALSVIGLLLWQPELSLSYGFALSALATIGLVVLAPNLVEVFEKRMPTWLAIVISVSIAAQIACLPVLLMLQPELPVYSILANVLAEPLVAPITVLGLLACLISPIAPFLSSAITLLASIPGSFIVYIGKSLASAPMASISWYQGVTGVVLGGLVTLSVGVLLLTKVPKLRVVSGSVLALIVLTFTAQGSSAGIQTRNFFNGDYTLVNCDVGQGDSLVIRSKGEIAVIDVGRDNPAIDSCLSGLGISRIDLLVLTHFDMDHIGGVVGAVTGRVVEQALVTSSKDERPGADFAKGYLEGLGIPMAQAEVGMTGVLGNFSWQVLSPHLGAPEAKDTNDGSISMVWQDDSIALITLADLGESGQLRVGAEHSALLSSGFGDRQVVVKVAHHGSGDQASELYEAIEPDVALISVGLGNSYGHPTRRVLELLEVTGAQVFRTDQSGAIGVTEGENGLAISVSGRS
ncbi:MAG: ComEC/Rec2 family competence protein [Microbacteriaceae bacterium]|nr:ComEC/Rec2 family competence protein [Microbacteriaceae bacterium]